MSYETGKLMNLQDGQEVLKVLDQRKSDLTLLAPAFAQATANAVGTHVTKDGKYYLLPEGHTAGTAWENTSKTQRTVGGELTDLKSTFALETETIQDTVQTIAFDSSGNVQSITHTRDNVAVRTDVFTFGANTIAEVRTLSTGESLTIVTNTDTLVTTITYADAA